MYADNHQFIHFLLQYPGDYTFFFFFPKWSLYVITLLSLTHILKYILAPFPENCIKNAKKSATRVSHSAVSFRELKLSSCEFLHISKQVQ